jgi:hypothetical protein
MAPKSALRSPSRVRSSSGEAVVRIQYPPVLIPDSHVLSSTGASADDDIIGYDSDPQGSAGVLSNITEHTEVSTINNLSPIRSSGGSQRKQNIHGPQPWNPFLAIRVVDLDKLVTDPQILPDVLTGRGLSGHRWEHFLKVFAIYYN